MLPLEDAVVYVVSRPLGPVNTKHALTQKLESLGAKVASRWGKEVTHIVFMRQRTAGVEEQLAEDSDLRALYEKSCQTQQRPY